MKTDPPATVETLMDLFGKVVEARRPADGKPHNEMAFVDERQRFWRMSSDAQELHYARKAEFLDCVEASPEAYAARRRALVEAGEIEPTAATVGCTAYLRGYVDLYPYRFAVTDGVVLVFLLAREAPRGTTP